MPYTNKSLTWAWFITFGLFVVTGSGVATGVWLLLFFLIALAAPAFILRHPSPIPVTAASHERARIVSDARPAR
jgi:hypothetical protein